MNKFPFFLFPALFIFLFSACEQDPSLEPAHLKVQFKATMNGQPLEINQPFIGPEGLRMTVEDFRFYISEFTLTGSSGQNVMKEIALIDFTDQQTDFQMDIPAGTYQNLRLAVGVPPALNGIGISGFNPAAYPPGHPLNIQNDMYWTSNTGYVFLRIQGKIDTSATQDQPMLFPWFYHSGLSGLYGYRSISHLDLKARGGEDLQLDLSLEVNDLFNTPGDSIRMTQDNFTHTTDHFDLAAKVIRNLRQAIKHP